MLLNDGIASVQKNVAFSHVVLFSGRERKIGKLGSTLGEGGDGELGTLVEFKAVFDVEEGLIVGLETGNGIFVELELDTVIIDTVSVAITVVPASAPSPAFSGLPLAFTYTP